MTLRHLTIFLCVCDEKNMTAAAEKLHIAQPSVSQAIGELEKHYNVKLFERLGRKLFLTIAGENLVTYARHIANLHRDAEQSMREVGKHGALRIGASITVGTHVLHDIIKEFIQNNPHVKITSAVNNTKVIEEMLMVDQLDIGLVEGMIHSQGVVHVPFMDDELVLICTPSHPFAGKVEIELSELSQEEFIIREEGSGTRELFESAMASHGVTWQTAGVYNNAESIKNAVSAGFGLTVISRMSVQKEAARKELSIVKIKGIYFRRQFSIVYHRNKYISPVLKRFIQRCVDFEGKRKYFE